MGDAKRTKMGQIFRLLLLWGTLEQLGFVENCRIVDLDICKPSDRNPTIPCASGDKSKRYNGQLQEQIMFLTSRTTENAYPRRGKTARPCCMNWSYKKNMDLFIDSPHYDNGAYKKYCKEALEKNYEDPQIKAYKPDEKKFRALCIWTQRLQNEPDVAKRFMLGSGHRSVCPMYFLNLPANPTEFGIPKEKAHQIPMCLLTLNESPIWFMNSQLNTNAGCGRKFNLAAHYHVFTHENKAWRDTYRRKGKEDTSKCLWSKVPWCDYIGYKNSAPKTPCHKKPKKWPANYYRVGQRKTHVINYLHEEPEYVERNAHHSGCCDVNKFKDMLTHKSVKLFLANHDYARSCIEVKNAMQSDKATKISWFGKRKTYEWLSFCTIARRLDKGEEEIQKEQLLKSPENSRMCVLRAVDKTKYGDFSSKAVWCAFLKFRFPKDYRGKFDSFCKSKGSDPWPATFNEHKAGLKAKEDKKRAEENKRQAEIEKEEAQRMEEGLKKAAESAPGAPDGPAAPKPAATIAPAPAAPKAPKAAPKAPDTPKKGGRKSRRGGRKSRRGGRKSRG